MTGRIGFFLVFFISIANASPVDRNQVEVLDGDTMRVADETFRLVGFDAPETYRARCRSSVSWAIGRHSGFGSSWLPGGSILSGSHVPAVPAPPH